MQDSADGGSQFLVTNRLRRTKIDGAGYIFFLQEKDKGFDQIVRVHPGKPLASAAQRTAQKQFEHGNHLSQSATVFTQDDAETRDDYAGAFCPRMESFGFPIISEPGQKIIAGRRCFRELFIAMKAIIADRGKC